MCLTVVPVSSPAPVSALPPGLSRQRPNGRLSGRLTGRLAALALGAATLVVVPGAAPSMASSTYHCSGYEGCAAAGYGNAGYAAVSDKMFWRMYSGHNCTNYVAYRMIKAGMPAERPWSGTGMAYNWGHARSDITDQTPAVGAVAWFDRGAGGMSSSGHVAYVEKVVSATEIVISEDSWSGTFHWRTIKKDGSGWPSGFIHFIDRKALTVTTPPVIQGTPQVGVQLKAAGAKFAPGATHAPQWLRDGVPVTGATTWTYTPTAADLGASIGFRDTATRSGYLGTTVDATPTADVAPGVFARVGRPAVTGFPEVGQVLSAVSGGWAPAAESVAFRWKADGVWLKGRNGPTLTLTRDLVGKKVSIVEVARRAGYTTIFGASDELGPVVEGVVELSQPFVASGVARHGSTLSFAGGAWTPSDAAVAYEWLRDGVVVPGATTPTYLLSDADVGHLVSVRATVSRERYQPAVQTADFGTVTTPSSQTVKAGGRRRGAVVTVRIAAPAVAAPGGAVTATRGRPRRHRQAGRRGRDAHAHRPRPGRAPDPRRLRGHRRHRALAELRDRGGQAVASRTSGATGGNDRRERPTGMTGEPGR